MTATATKLENLPPTIDEDPNGKHYLAIQDRTGDTKIMWSKDNADEVEAARDQFNKLVKKGFAAFKVEGKKGDRGEQIREFDPSLERIILVPQMQGG